MRLVLDFPCNTLHFKTMGLITLTEFLYERNKKTSRHEKTKRYTTSGHFY